MRIVAFGFLAVFVVFAVVALIILLAAVLALLALFLAVLLLLVLSLSYVVFQEVVLAAHLPVLLGVLVVALAVGLLLVVRVQAVDALQARELLEECFSQVGVFLDGAGEEVELLESAELLEADKRLRLGDFVAAEVEDGEVGAAKQVSEFFVAQVVVGQIEVFEGGQAREELERAHFAVDEGHLLESGVVLEVVCQLLGEGRYLLVIERQLQRIFS